MNNEAISLAEAIKMAIDLEKNGQAFYTQAAETAQNESGKKIFAQLAKEEMQHLATFQTMLNHSSEIGDWRELVKGYPAPGRQVPVFALRKTKPDVAKARTDEIEALRIAMKQEREAIAFYERIANQAKDSATTKIFDFVREQETYHYDLLQAELDHIQQTGFWFDRAEFRMDGKF